MEVTLSGWCVPIGNVSGLGNVSPHAYLVAFCACGEARSGCETMSGKYSSGIIFIDILTLKYTHSPAHA